MRRWSLPPPVKTIALNSFNFQRRGRGEKKKREKEKKKEEKSKPGIYTCLRSPLSTSSAGSLVSFLSSASSSPCSVSLSSPLTAGLGYSFRRQAHSVSLLLEVIETEGGRGRGGGRKMEKKKLQRKQSAATAMQKKKKKGGK